jgi:hypothetical protein
LKSTADVIKPAPPDRNEEQEAETDQMQSQMSGREKQISDEHKGTAGTGHSDNH